MQINGALCNVLRHTLRMILSGLCYIAFRHANPNYVCLSVLHNFNCKNIYPINTILGVQS